MKYSITKTMVVLKKSPVMFFIAVMGLAAFQKCNAQSIVGKWQRDLTVVYTVDKATGKQVPLPPAQQKQYDDAIAKNGYVEFLEFKSDNTYTSTVTAGGDKKVHSDRYSLSGNKLDLNIPLVKGEKTTIFIESLSATQMLWDLEFMNKKTGVGYKRL
jgi:hypothetical protein